MPFETHSSSNHPAPMPKSSLPLLIPSRVAAILATNAGWRNKLLRRIVQSLMLLVASASAEELSSIPCRISLTRCLVDGLRSIRNRTRISHIREPFASRFRNRFRFEVRSRQKLLVAYRRLSIKIEFGHEDFLLSYKLASGWCSHTQKSGRNFISCRIPAF